MKVGKTNIFPENQALGRGIRQRGAETWREASGGPTTASRRYRKLYDIRKRVVSHTALSATAEITS